MYAIPMKRGDVLRELKALGWRYLREGGKHEIWTDGTEQVAVPRHREIAEGTARNILKTAKQGGR